MKNKVINEDEVRNFEHLTDDKLIALIKSGLEEIGQVNDTLESLRKAKDSIYLSVNKFIEEAKLRGIDLEKYL